MWVRNQTSSDFFKHLWHQTAKNLGLDVPIVNQVLPKVLSVEYPFKGTNTWVNTVKTTLIFQVENEH